MIPRRLPLDPEILRCRPEALVLPRPRKPVGWTYKTFALAMHLACLGVFGLTVVVPVVGPVGSGELARDLHALQEACAAAADWLLSLR